MVFDITQIAALAVLAFVAGVDFLFGSPISVWRPLIVGPLTGLILGDPMTGLVVGGLSELSVFGLRTFTNGGVLEPATGTIAAVILAISGALQPQAAIPLAIPIGVLTLNIEVLVRSGSTVFAHWADRYAGGGRTRGIVLTGLLGSVFWGLSRAIPIAALAVSIETVNGLIASVPAYVWSYIGIAGLLLPAAGIAALLNKLWKREYLPFYLLGFVLAAYLNISLVGIALFAVALSGFKWYSQRGGESRPAEHQ